MLFALEKDFVELEQSSNAKVDVEENNARRVKDKQRAFVGRGVGCPHRANVVSKGSLGVAPSSDKVDCQYENELNHNNESGNVCLHPMQGLGVENMHSLGDGDEAIKINEKATAKVWYNRGLANSKLMNYEEAVRDISQAISLDPSN